MFFKDSDKERNEINSRDIKPVGEKELTSIIKKAHQILWNESNSSAEKAFNELCKIIFIKIKDEKKKRMVDEPYDFQIKTHETNQAIALRIKKLYSTEQEKQPDIFVDDIKIKDDTLAQLVLLFQGINLTDTELDVKGLAFGKFMDSFFKGNFGQYFTPREIIQFIVSVMNISENDKIIDPSCGSGGFLLYALADIHRQAETHHQDWYDFAQKKLFGIEINEDIARIAKMNMLIHGDGHENIICANALGSIEFNSQQHKNPSFEAGTFDVVLANPPFGSKLSFETKSDDPDDERNAHLAKDYELSYQFVSGGKKKLRTSQKTEILFIERVWQFLKAGTGRAAIILPDGVLSNSSSQYVRDWIIEHFQINAIISLPQFTFKSYGAGVKTSILFLRKRAKNETINPDENIFMAIPQHIGYDATGRKIKQNDLQLIADLYHQFQKDHQPFFQVALSRE